MKEIQQSKFASHLIYFLLLNFIVTSLSAQVRNFDKIPTQEGETNLSVRMVIQDTQGFLWLATFSGLYRFEGDDFIIQHQFQGNNEINSDVTALLEDRENNIWIGTNNGLSKYNPETEKLVTYVYQKNLPNSIGSNKIRSLAMDGKGQIWIGTYDKGLFLYDSLNDSFTPVHLENYTPISPEYIKTIFIDENEKIWLGTFGDGLYCFNYKNSKIESVLNYREETEDQKLSNNYIYEIFKDVDGVLSVGTRNGLNVLNSTSNQFTDVSSGVFLPGSMNNYFRTIFRDGNNKLWIGTQNVPKIRKT